MSDAFVDRARLRNWEKTEAPAADRRVWLVAKGQFLRFQRSWVFWSVVALGVLLLVTSIIGPFAAQWGGGVDGGYFVYGLLWPASWLIGIAIILLAAPAIAEDVRFDAPLFYFSRPVTVRDYLQGKILFVAGLLLVLVMPAMLAASVGSLDGIGAQGPEPPALYPGAPSYEAEYYERDLERYHEERLPEWKATTLNSFGDWAFTVLILLVGTGVSTVFLAALTLALSAYTARGWHAAVAFVVTISVLGMVGIAAGELVFPSSSLMLLLAPSLWPVAATAIPLSAYYHWDDPRYPHHDPLLNDAAVTAPVALLFMVAATWILYRLTYRRLQRVGGIA